MIQGDGFQSLPTDSAARKEIPLARGVLDYFPTALAEVARLSKAGNDKHNPGEDLHWARGKSMDHADCIMRHLAERGTIDTDGITHSAKVAWRALALLQEELEAAGAPMARGARVSIPKPKGLTNDSCTFAEINQVPVRKAPALRCDKCGTAEIWHGYAPGELAHALSCGAPACNTPNCYGDMVRV